MRNLDGLVNQTPRDDAERKQVTVLFADVSGSMDLAEQQDPEEWRKIMQRFFSILADAVTRFEGTVDKFTGDGIMAVFGAPIAHEDHARRACYAALQMLDDVSEYAGELRRGPGLNFSTRIGINSGEVVAGAIGSDSDDDYTAIGHTVGLAQRMEALAEPGKAYVTESTAELAQGFLDLSDLGEFEIKGASRPVHVFELAGVGQARSRLDLARERGFSRFVGRDREMSVLEGALRQARDGSGGAVGIVAEPGIGKSRLCLEFVGRCRGEGVEVFEAQAQSHGQIDPVHAGAADAALLLRDRRPRPGAGGAREDRRPGAAHGPGLRRGPAADVRLPRSAGPRPPGAADEPGGPAAGPRRHRLPPRQHPETPQDAGPGDRGPALDRRGQRDDAGRPDRVDRRDEHPRRRQPQARVLPRLGELTRVPDDLVGAADPRPHARAAARPRRRGPLAREPRSPDPRAHAGQSLLHRGDRPRACRGRVPGGRARRVPADPPDRGRGRPGHRPGCARRPHRPPQPGSEAVGPGRLGGRQGVQRPGAGAGRRTRAGGDRSRPLRADRRRLPLRSGDVPAAGAGVPPPADPRGRLRDPAGRPARGYARRRRPRADRAEPASATTRSRR